MVFVEIALMLFVMFSGIRLIYGLVRRKFDVVKKIIVIAVFVIGIYFAVLVFVSLRSHNQLLGLGETKQFCGFYLDCHLGAKVTGVKKVKSVDSLPDAKPVLNHDFYIVTLEITNNAQRETLRLHSPIVYIVDESRTKYFPKYVGNSLVNSPQNGIPQLELPVSSTFGSFSQDLIFEIPSSTPELKLLIEEGFWFPEIFLIGDEKSLFHGKTFFQIEP